MYVSIQQSNKSTKSEIYAMYWVRVLSFRRTNMVVYTIEQRWEILRHYFENHANVAECVRELRTDLGRREPPSAPYVRYLVKKVKETGILIDKPKREKPKTAESVCEAPSTSIHRRSKLLNISETSS